MSIASSEKLSGCGDPRHAGSTLAGLVSWAFWAQDHESVRDFVITIAALVGIPFVIWRDWLHHRQTTAALQQAEISRQQAVTAQRRHEAQVDADRERRITDNFTRAVEQLGSDKLESRLGAIYALERIARESKADHWPIMETLTAYVWERAPWPPIRTTDEDSEDGTFGMANYGLPPQPATDIQAVLTVIGRRRREHEVEGQRLGLGRDLRRCELTNAHLEGAVFLGAHLERAVLIRTHLERAILCEAHLEEAILNGAYLQGAQFDGAHLQGAQFDGAHLQAAQLVFTDLTQDQFDSAITDESTMVPPHIKRKGQPQSLPTETQPPAGTK